MTISKDLFLAILSMDAYNRGYGAGINFGSDSDASDTKIGNAKILASKGDLEAQLAGFYGIAYDTSGVSGFSAGEKTIAYRGTDSLFGGLVIGSEIWNAYGVGAGSPGGKQAELAIKFYQSITTSLGANPQTANISVTGHSSGGGLAGLVGGLYGKYGALFDNMAFQQAATTAYAISTLPPLSPVYNDALKTLIYGVSDPWAPSFSRLLTTYTEGEFLQPNRSGQSIPQVELDLGPTNPELGGFDRHSISLAVILKYATDAGLDAGWKAASKYFAPALFDDSIGFAAGAQRYKGTSSLSNVMRDAIAYSAIDDGTTVFGDTAIRALFDDAGDLGRVLLFSNASSTFTDPAMNSSAMNAATAISRILSQFAGQIALGQVLKRDHLESLAGVLTLAGDQKIMSVEFSDALWGLGRTSGNSPFIVGRDDLIRKVLSVRSALTPSQDSDIEGGMKWLWGSDDAGKFDRAVFATTNDVLTATLQDHTSPSSQVTLFVAGGAADKITGSHDDDFIYGGNGADELWSGGGNDLLAGGAGDDLLHVSAEDVDHNITAARTYLAGGEGVDTVTFEAFKGGTFELSNTSQSKVNSASAITVTHGNDVAMLQSVEKIKLSEMADTLKVGASVNAIGTNSNLYGLQEADAAGGVDTIDFTGARAGITVDSNKVVGPETVLKNFEHLIGTDFADTFKFSAIADIASWQKIDAAGQSDGTSDTIDFSQIGGEVGVTIANHTLSATQTILDNFEEIIGTGAADVINYSNGKVNIELHGGDGGDNLTTGDGNDLLDGGAGGDQLQGGQGFDRYFVTNGDTVTDSDGSGSITAAAGLLSGGKRIGPAGAFTNANGDQYLWSGEGDGAGTLIIDTHSGERVTVTDFRNGQLGITLKEIPKPDPLPPVIKHPTTSPLVLDLDGNGISLSSTASGVHFDFGGDHFREATGWVNPGDGLLVYDANHDGAISDGTELFGNATTDGFSVLAFYDGRTGGNFYSDPTGGTVDAGNANGVIDAGDAIYSQLQVWRDLNQDGIAQANELTSLADAGIARINLNHVAPDAETELNAEFVGNTISQVATFERQDGSTAAIGDAWFSVDQSDTIYDGPTVAALDHWPDLHGYGSFNQLHNVLSANAGLKAEFRAFIDKVQDQSISSLMPQFEKLMYEWAGIPENYSVNRGEFIDARVLAFLEDAYGQEYHQLTGWNEGTNAPGPWATGVLNSVFHNAIASYFVKFLAQVPDFTANVGDADGNTYVSKYAALGAALHYNPVDDSVQFDAPALATALSSLDLGNPAAVQNALDIFGSLTMLEAYDLQSNAEFYSALRDALVNAGAGKLLPLIDSFRIYDSSNTYTQTSADGVYDYAMRSFNFDNSGKYTIVEAGAVVEYRQDSHFTYVSDLFYVQAGLGTVTFSSERGNLQEKIILSSDFNNAAYTIVEDPQSGHVTMVFASLGTTIVLKSYLDAQANHSSFDWSTGTGDSRIIGQTIYFANGTVLNPVDIAELVVQGTDGNDALKGIWLNQTIDGKGGNDIIDGGGYSNTIIGGAGNDLLSGNGSQGVFVFNIGDGNDTISQSQGSTLHLNGIAPADIHLTRGGSGDADLLITFPDHSSDSINILNEFGTASVAKVVFGDGTVWSIDDLETRLILQNATDGDDVIVGFDGSDILAGGRGNDILQGGPSAFGAGDTYIYERGDGNDTIIPSSINVVDTLKLLDIRSDQVSVTRNGTDAILSFSVSEGGSITLQNQFGPNGFHGLEKVIFSDGVVWSQRDFVVQSESSIDTPTITGTDGNEVLTGTNGNDGIAGFGGDDVLQGGAGSDTYFFGVGSGHDIIEDNGPIDYLNVDVVKLALLPSEVELSRASTDVIVRIIATGETLTLAHFFTISDSTGHSSSSSVERLEFSDGTVWDVPEITANAWIRGAEGNVTVTGTRDADTIVGGAGDDLLRGIRGSDTFVIKQGSGRDTIEASGLPDDHSVVSFVDSAVGDVVFGALFDQSVSPQVDQIVISRKDGSASAVFDRNGGVDEVKFSDGTVLTRQEVIDRVRFIGTDAGETIFARSNSNDIIVGGKGADELWGGGGSDTYVWSRGDGNDTIKDFSGPDDSDTLHLSGIDPSLVRLERVAHGDEFNPFYDLAVHIQPLQTTDTFETITIAHEFDLAVGTGTAGNGIEFITFDNGVVWSRAQFAAYAPLVGTSSAETIDGSEFADVITGGLGDDYLRGGPGSDTYVWNAGDGNDRISDGGLDDFDKLLLHGTDPFGVRLILNSQFESPDVLVHINATGEEIRLSNQLSGDGRGLDQIVFDNGVVWNADYIAAHSTEPGMGTEGDDVLTGDDGDNVLNGLGGNDTISGLGGDDVITGGAGNDLLSGGSGDDRFVATVGDGADVIHGGDGVDTLDFSAISTSITVDMIAGTATGIDIGADSFTEIETVLAGSGDDLIVSGTGDDNLDGGDGFDTLSYHNAAAGVNIDLSVTGPQDTVGAGQDTLHSFEALVGSNFADHLRGDANDNSLTGLAGADKFVFTGTFGHDSITDFSVQEDSLEFWDTLFVDKAAVLAAASQVGSDVVIDGGSKGSVTLTGVSLADLADLQVSIVPGAVEIDKPQSMINTSIGSALVVASNNFNLIENPEIVSSTTIPHASIAATASGEGKEYYAVTVGAGDHVIFDIDHGFDTVMQLLDASGNALATNDDDDSDPGSSQFNSLIDYTFDTAGTYFLAVGQFAPNAASGTTPDAGSTYTLNISVQAPPDTTAPQPVIAGMSQGQSTALILNGTSEAGSVVQIFDGTTLLGAATTGTSGLWSFTTGSLPDALHTFSVTATDLAGNVGSGTGIVQYGRSGVDAVAIAATLQASNFVYEATNADWHVSATGVAETLSRVESVVDGAGHRFLLVGGGSQYATIQAAVNAASNGDTILIAPGSYTENVAIAGKAISLEGFGGTTLHGSITEAGTLDGALTIDGIAIDATGQQYGVLVSANSTGFAGSVTLDHASIANAKLNGFAYIENGNGSTPTHTDTIGSVSILNSVFSGNATQASGSNGRGDILLYGYNGNFTANGVTIGNPGAGAQKAIQLRGVQTSANTANVGPYQSSGDISLTNLNVSGTYTQDLLAFYRYADLGSFSASGVTLNAAAPWGLLNFDEVGGTVDLSNGISATNLAAGAPVAVEQGLNSHSTFVGTSGNDVLVSNGGVDSLSGGAGHNTYIATPSTGQATIYASAGPGTTNELDFVGGITDRKLWFEQSGNDLKIDLLGTNTQVDVNGWFANTSNQLQEITAGGLKIDSQVSQLVQAMATYSANNPGFDPTATGNTAVPSDSTLQSAIASAWHT